MLVVSWYVLLILTLDVIHSYDHLHLEAVLALDARSTPDRPVLFFVPLGVKALLVLAGIEGSRVHELDWWTGMSFPIPIPPHGPTLGRTPSPPPAPSAYSSASASLSSSSPPTLPIPLPRITFTHTPTQHNSGRGVFDQGATLWGSWVVKQVWGGVGGLGDGFDGWENEDSIENGKREKWREKEREREASVWFAGDTGYQTSDGPCPVFKGQSFPFPTWKKCIVIY